MESLVSDLCGLLPSSKRFPMIGKGVGPGGSLVVVVSLAMNLKVCTKVQAKKSNNMQLKESISL